MSNCKRLEDARGTPADENMPIIVEVVKMPSEARASP